MKNLLLAASACAFVLGTVPVPHASADDSVKSPEKAAIRWIEGWSAGREAAKKSGKLMFVYVHRVNPG